MPPTWHTRNPGRRNLASPARAERAAVLLEVVLALTLFVFAAGILSSSLQTAVERTRRLHDQAHALDLAASLLAEVEMGLRPRQPAGPEPFEPPFESWTWQIEASPHSFGDGERQPLHRVSVVVRNPNSTAVQRLAAIVSETTSAPNDPDGFPSDPLFDPAIPGAFPP